MKHAIYKKHPSADEMLIDHYSPPKMVWIIAECLIGIFCALPIMWGFAQLLNGG